MMPFIYFFFFNDTATTEIYTLSLHDALPISVRNPGMLMPSGATGMTLPTSRRRKSAVPTPTKRSEEHTSELQSHVNLVCRLLLEKKKKNRQTINLTPTTINTKIGR